MHRRDAPLPEPTTGDRFWAVDLEGKGRQWFKAPSFHFITAMQPLIAPAVAEMQGLIREGQAAADRVNAEALAAWEADPQGERPEPVRGGVNLRAMSTAGLAVWGACIGLSWHGRAYVLDTKAPAPAKAGLTEDVLFAYGIAVADELEDHYTVAEIGEMGQPAILQFIRRLDVTGEAAKRAAFFGPPRG